MKKGFTLIELLAVIVILAIIALIATPIILGIINDARKESNERSAELYASAVKNAIASYQLTHPNAPTTFEDLDVEYDGNVVCETEELYSDGSFYIADCTANGDAVEYTYGEMQVVPYVQVFKPGSYVESSQSSIGDSASGSESAPAGRRYYIGYDVTDGILVDAYGCFLMNEKEYCIKRTSDGSAYQQNKEILEDAFKGVENACSSYSDQYVTGFKCTFDGIVVNTWISGYVGFAESATDSFIDIWDDGRIRSMIN